MVARLSVCRDGVQLLLAKEKSRGYLRLLLLNCKVDAELILVVLVSVDLTAGFVLFAVQLPLLALGQMTVVSGHVGLLLVLGFLFAIFQVRGLARGQLAAGNTIGDAVLLIGFAGVDFIDARMPGIDLSRTGLWLRRGGANQHQATRCQD